jgi:4-diphosphocytidyl-2-C-methyl-D-erythritol kinase
VKKHKIKSFCKINLSLRVIKKLNNGYHNIKSLITFCKLYDVITINKIKGLNDKITFSGRFKKGINKKLNTITEVLFLLRKRKFFAEQAFKINIKKNIPQGAGLGGGSSNAADLLNFLNSKMSLKLNKNEIKKIANQIGFDVPITLKKQNTLLTGKKDRILRLNHKFKLNILIVYPNIICSTKRIYEKNKKLTPFKSESNFRVMSRKKLINYLKNEDNDLEKVVTRFYPKIGKIIDLIKAQNGCYFSRITGSGSACFGIFSNVKTAFFAQKMIKLKFPNYWSVVSKTM